MADESYHKACRGSVIAACRDVKITAVEMMHVNFTASRRTNDQEIPLIMLSLQGKMWKIRLPGNIKAVCGNLNIM